MLLKERKGWKKFNQMHERFFVIFDNSQQTVEDEKFTYDVGLYLCWLAIAVLFVVRLFYNVVN